MDHFTMLNDTTCTDTPMHSTLAGIIDVPLISSEQRQLCGVPQELASTMALSVGLCGRISVRPRHGMSPQARPRAQATEQPETWELSMMSPEFTRRLPEQPIVEGVNHATTKLVRDSDQEDENANECE